MAIEVDQWELLDRFAGLALAGLVGNPLLRKLASKIGERGDSTAVDAFADHAYRQAAAMLRARAKIVAANTQREHLNAELPVTIRKD